MDTFWVENFVGVNNSSKLHNTDVLLAYYVKKNNPNLFFADVLLAYYVTTRLWHLYHAVACNKTMRWARLFLYFP